jgi:predicted RNA-binding Zn-ribbon protein involved in translation (DUF1610 family)
VRSADNGSSSELEDARVVAFIRRGVSLEDARAAIAELDARYAKLRDLECPNCGGALILVHHGHLEFLRCNGEDGTASTDERRAAEKASGHKLPGCGNQYDVPADVDADDVPEASPA